MAWTEDGWLRIVGGGNLVRTEAEAPALPEFKASELPDLDDFDSDSLGIQYYTPRIATSGFCDLTSRKGWLRMRGSQSLSSTDKVSLIARKLTSLNASVMTKMDFDPDIYQHSAGLVFYYDCLNYVFFRKYWSQTLQGSALSITEVSRGIRDNHNEYRIPAPEGIVWMKLDINERTFRFSWSDDGSSWNAIGEGFQTYKLSDEYSEYGEFTGSMVGITCKDSMFRRKSADFDFFSYEVK